MKVCRSCATPYHDVEGNFSRHPSSADRLQYDCKKCQKQRNKERYQANIEIEREKRLKWQDENRDLHNKHARDYYQRNKNVEN